LNKSWTKQLQTDQKLHINAAQGQRTEGYFFPCGMAVNVHFNFSLSLRSVHFHMCFILSGAPNENHFTLANLSTLQ